MSAPLRLATYNVEWFNALFDDKGALLADEERSARYGVTRGAQLDALARVFTALDADGVMIIEAPDTNTRRKTVTALETFAAAAGLRARDAVIGFQNDTQQEIAFLYDPDVLSVRHDPQGDTMGAPMFDRAFQIDLDIDATPDTVRFSKPPLELAVETHRGASFRLIGVHAKSKAPHGAKDEDDATRISIANRRKQLAQCIWLRRRVEALLEDDPGLMVMGDFNDGPGLDQYEALFGRSSVEIVLGHGGPLEKRLFDPNAQRVISGRGFALPASARFFIPRENRYLSVLLDYVMVSPALRSRTANWRIWHPFDDPECFSDDALRHALLAASDHFPVSVELDLA